MKNFMKNVAIATVVCFFLGFVSCSENTTSNDPSSSNTLSGSISTTVTLDATLKYTLEGALVIEKGGDLILPAGTIIESKTGFSNYIIVLQGGQIHANGTAIAPVIFTSQTKQAGSWGGLIINGYAPISGTLTENNVGSTEIATEFPYGGTNENDNSGTLKFVKLLYTGANNGDDVEHNGLTLNGVGRGTLISDIFIKDSNDDSIECFGGTVNITNLLSVDADDDMFDFTQGYSGTLTNIYGIWNASHLSSEGDPRGIEADGNLDGANPNAHNQSNFTIHNLTLEMLNPGKEDGMYMHDAIKIRRGATLTLTNALIKGQGQVKDLIDCKDKKGNANPNTSISIRSTLNLNLLGLQKNVDSNSSPSIEINSTNTGADYSVFTWTN